MSSRELLSSQFSASLAGGYEAHGSKLICRFSDTIVNIQPIKAGVKTETLACRVAMGRGA